MKNFSPLELAFLGDALHTAYVRKWALENFDKPINQIHLICSKKCCASHQSKVLSLLTLSPQEEEIARKARNVKAKHTAKNADVKDYKFATAFEALIGHLYVTDQIERMTEILESSVN